GATQDLSSSPTRRSSDLDALDVLDGLRCTLEALSDCILEALRGCGRKLDDLRDGHGGLLVGMADANVQSKSCAKAFRDWASGRLYDLQLPAAAAEQGDARDGHQGFGDRDRPEDALRPHVCRVRQRVRERELQKPEEHEVDPRRG